MSEAFTIGEAARLSTTRVYSKVAARRLADVHQRAFGRRARRAG